MNTTFHFENIGCYVAYNMSPETKLNGPFIILHDNDMDSFKT